MLKGFLEFRVAIEYEDDEVIGVYILGLDGHPKVDVLYCMNDEEIEQAQQAALNALDLETDKQEAMEEDRLGTRDYDD